MNIFEKATQIGLRFESNRGLLCVEEVWKLPLDSRNNDSLNSLGITLVKKLKEQVTISLVSSSVKKDDIDELRLEIIKHIISVKQISQLEAEHKEVSRTEIRKLEDIIARKKQKELEDLSVEELEALMKKKVI